jgi:RNA polymerase sigma factor for flagellar operon FliA
MRLSPLADILPLVDGVVSRMVRYLPVHVSRQDLESAGRLALVESYAEMNGKGAGAQAHCRSLVRGSVLDELRRQDPLSRYGRARVRWVRQATAELEIRSGKAPSRAHVAQATGLSVNEVAETEQLATAAAAVSIDAPNEGGREAMALTDDENPSPASHIESWQFPYSWPIEPARRLSL